MLNSKVVSTLAECDRNLATELCYGTLRWQSSLDDILARGSSRLWDNVDPKVRIILRMSAYQLQHTDRIPDHALVNDAVEIAKLELDRGKAGYVNALLRNLARMRPWEQAGFDEQRPPWIRASLPKWLWERWSARYGPDLAFRFAISLNQTPQSAFRGISAGDPPADNARRGIPSGIVPGARLAGNAAGIRRVWIQDEASQLIPHLLEPLTGSRVWDACAAPGGKSAILSSLCGKSGFLVSSDLSWKRIKRMQAALDRLQGRHAVVVLADATAGCPFPDSTFDAILADVPCSGLGTMRRNPEIKWRFRLETFPSLQKKQVAILNAVASALRVNGILLYSTCSTEPEENEQVIGQFLGARRDFRLIKPKSPAGVERWLDSQGILRTFPSERLWDGFFGALMHRVT